MEVMIIKIIFTIKTNTFYDDGSYYYITHSSYPHRYFKIDRDETLLKHIQKKIKKYSALKANSEQGGLHIAAYGTLKQIIYAYYTKKHISSISGKILPLDKDNLNCTFGNIYNTKDTNFKDACRDIWYEDNLIYMFHKPSKTTYIMTYNYELLNLLASPKISWYISGGRLYAKLQGTRKQRSTSLQQIVYLGYHHGLTARNIITQLCRLQKQFHKTGTAIDHLNNDIYNNTIENLSPMTRADNTKKPNPRKYFKQIFRLDMAYKDGTYLLRFVYKPKLFTDELRMVDYICDSSEKLIQKIKELKENKWQIRAKKDGIIVTDNKTYSVGGKLPLLQYIKINKSDIEIQRELAELI